MVGGSGGRAVGQVKRRFLHVPDDCSDGPLAHGAAYFNGRAWGEASTCWCFNRDKFQMLVHLSLNGD